jgi:UrcA family protein
MAGINSNRVQEDVMKINANKSAAVLAMLLCAALPGMTLRAMAAESPLVARVRYTTADLATPQAIARLYFRLGNAARRVCGPIDNRDLVRYPEWRSCVAQALSEGVRQIRSPELRAYHQLRTGAPVELADSPDILVSDALPRGHRNR